MRMKQLFYRLCTFSITIIILCLPNESNQACATDAFGSCLTCYPGWYKYMGGPFNAWGYCGQCFTNCADCNNNSSCDECSSGYGLNSPSECKICGSNCLECKAYYGTCTNCQSGYVKDLLGKCGICTANCIDCTENVLLCKTCASGYGLVTGNSACLQCGQYCNKCLSSYLLCETCINGYGKVGDGTCSQCEPFCLLCSEDQTVCTSCEAGKLLDSLGKCGQCPSNCALCETDLNDCEECEVGYGKTGNGNCQECESLCEECSEDFEFCTNCELGQLLDTLGKCGQCPDNCNSCETDLTKCESCDDGYGKATDGTCPECENFCELCSEDSEICTFCETGYGVTNLGKCMECSSNCIDCSINVEICESCDSGYGILINFDTCDKCSSKCLQCSADSTKCIFCEDGYGINSHICSQCENHCNLCQDDYTFCTECSTNYGLVIGQGDCELCTDYCLECFDDHNICTLCQNDGMHGLNIDVCVECHSDCFNCSHIGYYICTSCHITFFLDGNSCSPCPLNCLICSSETFCEICSDGFIAEAFGHCLGCPDYCELCHHNTNSETVCSKCISGAYELDKKNPERCRELCGDYVTTLHECDNGLSISYDGCNNDCEVMPGFICKVLEDSSTICSYKNTLQVTFVSFVKEKFSNSFELIVSVYPPLYVFISSTEKELKNIFDIVNNGVTVTSVKYDINKNEIIFKADYADDLMGEEILINFEQALVSDQLTSFPLDEIIIQSYALSKFTYNLSKLMFPACIIITIMAWISFLIGMLLRKLAGLEALIVIQFSWLTIFWVNSYLPLPLGETLPLKYSQGYNPFMFEDNSPESYWAPYTSQFYYSSQNLANNFNVSLFITLVPLLLSIITHFQFNKYKMKYSFDDETSVEYIKLLSLESRYYISQQFLLTSIFIFFINFVHTFVCYFMIGGDLEFVPNWIFSMMFLIIGLGVIVKFHFDPHCFGFFRYEFKNPPRFINHIFLEILAFIIMIVFLVITPKLPFLILIPCVFMIIYSITVKPYLRYWNNFRSAFNFFVIASFVIFKILSLLFPIEFAKSVIWVNLLLIMNVFLLLPMVITIANILMIYEYFFVAKIKEITEIMERMPIIENKFRNMKVLKELTVSNVNKKMRTNSFDSAFKSFLPSSFSIRTGSNIAWDELGTDIELQKIESEGLKLMKASLRNEGYRPRTYSEEQATSKSKKIREEVKREFMNDVKNHIEKRKNKEKQKIIPEDMGEDDLDDTGVNSGGTERKILPGDHDRINSYKSIAKQVLLEENVEINHKGALTYLEQYEYNVINTPVKIFLDIYDKI